MEIAALTAFLAPVLPTLLNIGGAVADNISEGVVVVAQRLWAKLWGQVEAKAAAKEAAQDVAMNPDDEDFRTVLAVQLRKLLTDDPALAAEVTKIWQDAQAAGVPGTVTTVTASGAGSIAVGGNVSGSQFTAGGDYNAGQAGDKQPGTAP